ncbi:isochorismatase hydrolase [Desulfovibrio sp. X2]|uniref:cysteine hydrolase n=1 Tax=Desulfovibrio sp. X2 TaxID=941449 RepID=UPI000358D246|nr:cysteine hydrolase [Desulfovibrio sp. X2]EPR41616.1 isochorismatase hydrolase [Desulfovibrio sp. X2]
MVFRRTPPGLHPARRATRLGRGPALALLAVLAVLAVAGWAFPALAGDIVADWEQAAPPAAPEPRVVQLAGAKAALLVLDIEEHTCNAERRPRCLETVPAITELVRRARASGMPVIHSLARSGTREGILPSVAPLPDEPVIQSSVDKFYKTKLAALLKERGVKTVVVTGTAAHGAVLATATEAAVRGLDVVLPVDCISSESLYTEQAAVWLLHEGPATRGRLKLTRAAMIVMPGELTAAP